MDCVGSWGACAGPPAAQFKTYTWTIPPLNCGSTATCGYPDGQTDTFACANLCLGVPLPTVNGGSTGCQAGGPYPPVSA